MAADWLRYPRLYVSFARYCLIREMTFRVNFLLRCVAGLGWLGLLIFFFQLIYLQTERIGDWGRYEFLFFLGTSILLNTVINAFFLDNCTSLSDLIRKGDLDFALLKPIDEQFLLSCQRIDISEVPKVLVGFALIIVAAIQTGIAITPMKVLVYLVLLTAGIAILYSLLIAMAASSVWMVRNTGLYEAWFYVTQFARYPSDIYNTSILGLAVRYGLTYVLPVFLAVNMPARYLADLSTGGAFVAYLFVAACLSLYGSRRFFMWALGKYRSASS